MNFNIAEKFVSINGEGLKSGQLAVFIRLTGCNLNCSYCDTSWANKEDTPYSSMSEEEIYQYILDTGITNVTLTGGEPLLAKGVEILLKKLSEDKRLSVEVETNGSVDIRSFMKMENRPSFTMDYKLPSSGMENHMLLDNMSYLTKKDTVKFVCSDDVDLKRAKDIMDTFCLVERTNVHLSPVFGAIEPWRIVEFMKEKAMKDVTLQLQMHKVIWDKDRREV